MNILCPHHPDPDLVAAGSPLTIAKFRMYLRALQLNVSSAAELPSGFDFRDLSASNRAVVEAYVECLPKRRVILGDAKKVNVQLGPRPAAGVFSHADFGIFPDGIGWIWMPAFDFCAVGRANAQGRQTLLLEALHQGVVALAQRTNSDSAPFLAARDSVIEMIPLVEIRQK